MERCFCSKESSKPACYLRRDIFNISAYSEKRAYNLTETNYTKAECCAPSPYDGKDYTIGRTEVPPGIESSQISGFINLYKKYIIPIITEQDTAALEFFSFLDNNNFLEGSHDAAALIEEMALINEIAEEKTGEKVVSARHFENLIKRIVRHVQHPSHKILSTSCSTCQQEPGGRHHNGNCNSVFRPNSAITEIGTGPSCRTDFIKDPKYSGDPEETRAVLVVLLSSALFQSRIMKGRPENLLLVDVEGFLIETKIAIRNFETNKVVQMMEVEINKRIEAWNKIITEEFKPKLNHIHSKFDFELSKKVSNLTRLLAETNPDKEKVRTTGHALMLVIALKTSACVMDVAMKFADFMGPQVSAAFRSSQAISRLKNLGATGLDSTLHINAVETKIKLAAKSIKVYLNTLQLRQLLLFDLKLVELESEVEKLSNSHEKKISILTHIHDYQSLRKAILKDNDAINKKLTELSTNETTRTIQNLGNAINLIKTGSDRVPGISEVLFHPDLEYVTKTGLAVHAAVYDQMISAVSKFLKPLVAALLDDVKDWTETKSFGNSLLQLNFKSFGIRENFAKLKNDVSRFDIDLTSDWNLAPLADELGQVLGFVIKAQEKNLVNAEIKSEIDFHARLAGNSSVCDITNKKLQKTCVENKLFVEQAQVFWMYEQAKAAFILSRFPLAAEYEKYFIPYGAIIGNKSLASRKDMAEFIIPKIDDLLSALRSAEHVRSKSIDVKVRTEDLCPSGSIYEWQSEHDQSNINDILSGKRVKMSAAVLKGLNPRKYNAIKFKTLHLEFIPIVNIKQPWPVVDEVKLEEINKILNHFRVHMTHPGTSQFVLDNRYYTLEHAPQELQFDYGGSKQDRLQSSNDAFKKLARGPWSLSPYTSWSIWLKPRFPENVDFFELKKFLNESINLKLCGKVWYLGSGYSERIGQDKLDEFYPNSRDDWLEMGAMDNDY